VVLLIVVGVRRQLAKNRPPLPPTAPEPAPAD
jgi:hypothetical protein